MSDPRYRSGTSLERTAKEQAIDWLEDQLRAEFTDEFCADLGKLPLRAIVWLQNLVAEFAEDLTEEISNKATSPRKSR